MEKDNFDLIKSLLSFEIPNTFFFVQILKRKKENPEMGVQTSVIDNFYLYEPEDLDKLKSRITERCKYHNARAYVNLNRLDLEKVALYTQKEIIDCIINGNFKDVKNAYASACGSHHSEKVKKWVVDIDEEVLHRKDEIVKVIEDLHEEIFQSQMKKATLAECTSLEKYKILAEIPTRTGIHLISEPFNPVMLSKHLQSLAKDKEDPILKVEIKKNSPTCLYIP